MIEIEPANLSQQLAVCAGGFGGHPQGGVRGALLGDQPQVSELLTVARAILTGVLSDKSSYSKICALHDRTAPNRIRPATSRVRVRIKRRSLTVGLDGTFSGHSLGPASLPRATPRARRAGHHAPRRGRSASVMRGYVEEGSIWNDNAAARLGL